MANLQEKLFWEPGIYQLETSDPVLAGPDGIDNLQGKQLANRTVYLKDQVEQLASGKQPAGNAAKLSAARKIEATGDGSWNIVFDGSRDVSGQLTLRDSGVAPGDYGIVTVDAKGRVTAARQMSRDDVPAHDWGKIVSGKPNTLAGYGIGDGASKADLQNAVNSLVSGAPANLNTLQELAAAVNNDPKYSATVDGKLASKADKATTLAGYGITDAQPSNPDLAALANLKGATGFYVNTGPGAATVRSLAAGQGISVSNGDGKAGNPTVALANSGASAGTYGMVTVDAMGRVTAGRQMGGEDVPAHDWGKIASGKPNTLAGYGISDAASKNDLQIAVSGLVSGAPANLNTLQELAAAVNNDSKFSVTLDGKLADKADKATTLAGYGITDAVTVAMLPRKNLLQDSGRFCDPSETYANPLTKPFLIPPWNKYATEVSNSYKYSHDNISYGGGNGVINPIVQDLLKAMKRSNENARYGSEFYVAEFKYTSATYGQIQQDGRAMSISTAIGASTDGIMTLMLWIRCQSGSIMFDVATHMNGQPFANRRITPADGWVHLAGVSNWNRGYSTGHLRAEDNSNYQIALPAALSGVHLGYMHVAPISF